MLLVSTSLIFVKGWEIVNSIKAIKPVKSQNYSICDISPGYIGNSPGNWYLYQVTGWLYGSGTSKDSIFEVASAITPYCDTIPNVGFRAEVWNTPNFSGVDTAYQFIRSDSAVDYYGNIVYRVNYTNWEGIDTCIIKLNYPYPIGSVDDDSLPDTLYVRSSPGTLISKNVDTVYTRVEIRYKIKTTSTIQGLPMDSILEYDKWKFKLRENYGFTQIGIDSAHIVFFITGYGSLPIDTFDVFMKILQGASFISEKTNTNFKLIGNKIYFDKPHDGKIFIYRTDGTLYRSLYFRGNELDLSSYKGLYIIRIGKNYIRFVN